LNHIGLTTPVTRSNANNWLRCSPTGSSAHSSAVSGAGAGGLGSKVAQNGEVLAEAMSNIANRIVTPISSEENVELELEDESDVGRRYI